MNPQITDLCNLIDAARRDEPEAIDRLLEQHRHYLNLLARNWIGNALRQKSDASDLVQQTMMNAFSGFQDFRGRTESELAAWLRQILANNLAQLIRRFQTGARSISRDRSLDNTFDRSSQAIGDVLAASGTSPSMIVAGREQGVILAQALAELNADQREVVVLRNFEQLDWGEIAKRMNRTNGAVRMLWVRALRQLKPLIEGRLESNS